MIKEYLEERKEILSSIIRKNQDKYEHNQIAIAESNNQINELNQTIDEASQIFSVKARESNGFKNQEISEIESRIAAYIIENNEYQKNIDKAQSELSIVENCLQEIIEKENVSEKLNESENVEYVSRETSEIDFVEHENGTLQFNFDISSNMESNDAYNKEIIEKLEFCKSIAEIDGKRVNIELNNIINMLK